MGELEMQGLNEKDTNTIRDNQHQAKEKIKISENCIDRTTSENQDDSTMADEKKTNITWDVQNTSFDSKCESERKKYFNNDGNINSTLGKAIFQLDKTVNVLEIHQ